LLKESHGRAALSVTAVFSDIGVHFLLIVAAHGDFKRASEGFELIIKALNVFLVSEEPLAKYLAHEYA
jgi:hypothetical protein